MEPIQIFTLIWANKEEILGVAGSIVLVASTIAQHTTNDKDDRIISRIGSILDILSGAVGKAAPRQHFAIEQKPSILKDVKKLTKHIITGKYE